MGFEVGNGTPNPNAEAGLVLLHLFDQNQKVVKPRWD